MGKLHFPGSLVFGVLCVHRRRPGQDGDLSVGLLIALQYSLSLNWKVAALVHLAGKGALADCFMNRIYCEVQV